MIPSFSSGDDLPPTTSRALARAGQRRQDEGSGDGRVDRVPAATYAMAFRIFTVLWAVASIFHQLAALSRHSGPFRYALTLAALWLLLRPSSVARLAVLAAAQLALVAYYMPMYVTNHWIFTSFVNLTILAAMCVVAWRRRSLQIHGSSVMAAFAPFVRIEVVILYFYAVLHKLNTDFLAPASSCAMNHYGALTSRYPLLPTGRGVTAAAISGTLVIEAAIPVLLIFRRTRVLGAVIGMVFHFVLAMNPEHKFYNFSAMIFAVYFLFLPFNYTSAVRKLAASTGWGRNLLAHSEPGKLQLVLRRVIIGVMAVVGTLFLLGFDPQRYGILIGGSAYANRLLWAVYGGTLIVIFLYAAFRWSVANATSRLVSFRPEPRILLIFPALVLLNGFSPYLGLKTETSFSMFSNLRTEAGVSNHLFIPTSFRVATFQDDLVVIVDAPNSLMPRRDRGKALPYVEFRRRAAQHPEHSVTFWKDEQFHVVDRIADHPELATPPPLLVRKFGHFRPIDISGAAIECSH